MTGTIIDDAAAGRAKLKGLTVEQYDALIENGWFSSDPRTELIDGFIVQKDRSHVGEDPMTIGDRHRMAVERLSRFKGEFDSFGCYLQNQQPIVIPPDHEPEPDGSVIKGSLDASIEKPKVGDVLSVIEVSDASLHYDLHIKLAIYAKARIPQYIVVDLINNVVLVHEKPKSKMYGKVVRLERGEVARINVGAGKFIDIPAERLLPGLQ
jgi:Uma2 family endonuclease